MNDENNSATAEPYCTRCKMRLANFECSSCSPFKYFCSSCDGYVHAMSTKRGHTRNILEIRNSRIENLPLTKPDLIYQSLKRSKDSIINMNSLGSEAGNDKEINYHYNLGSNYHGKISGKAQSDSYFNDVTKMYDKERDDLSNKLINLERHSENTKNSLNDRITQLQNDIRDNQRRNNQEIRILKESHADELDRVTNEMGNEIKFLVGKNRELERSNEEYFDKLNGTTEEVTYLKQSLNERFSLNELERKKAEEEIKSIKIFFEKRIKFINDSFAEEKAKLIAEFERNNDRLNSGYKESKEKYLNLIDSIQKDYKDLSKNSKIEEE